jgi:hypothetical protein
MMIELDLDTKLALLQKHTLMKINEILNENFLYGQIGFVSKWLLDPNHCWKQNLVDECLVLISEYKQRKKELLS